MSYYTAVIILCWLTLAVLSVLVRENDRLSRSEKKTLYLTHAAVALAALAEWLGVRLSGHEAVPVWLLRAVKCADYMLTPVAGGAVAAQLKSHSVWMKRIMGVLAVNVVFQFVSAFTGWMMTVDAQHRYAHGPLYKVYIVLYLILIMLVIIEFFTYGQNFRRQNRVSLYAILCFVLAGILMQELAGGEVRTAYLAMTVGICLMFIHVTEFSQLAADDAIHRQELLIRTDTMTGVYSRHAYSAALGALDEAGALPADLVVFSIDVNGLKGVNDTLGHVAGDELICGAADCIRHSLGDVGSCYRTGGDEFIVLALMDPARAQEKISALMRAAAAWHGQKVEALYLAAGSAAAAEHPELTAEKLVGAADQAMYRAKSEYYRSSGHDRRRR